MGLTQITPFKNITFDLDQKIDLIEVKERNDGSGCYVCLKSNNYEIINNFIIYNGKLVRVGCAVSFDKKSDNNKYVPRLTFYKKSNDGKLKETKSEKIIIEFSKSKIGLENFWKLISFLKNYKDLVDTGTFDKKYHVVNGTAYIEEFKTKKDLDQVKELKKMNIDSDTLKKYLSDTRKNDLDIFKKMLEDEKEIDAYRNSHNIKQKGEEAVWHHFLKNKDWILGLNVDVRFIRDFNYETRVGNIGTDGVGSPSVDIMGLSDYTVLIELKTPSTDFFTDIKSSKSRAGTWSFTDSFIEGISQCLAQKSKWDKGQESQDLVVDGQVQDQRQIRTVDPKTIFIIGNKQRELNVGDCSSDNLLKRDTLERFKQNSKNIEIISYDELYERAYYIVYHKTAEKLKFSNNK